MGSANYNKCITLIKQGGLNHEKRIDLSKNKFRR